MEELSNSEFISSSRITYNQLPLRGFPKEIKSIIIMNFIGLFIFFSFPSIGIFQSIEPISYCNYKNHDFVQFVTSTILCFTNMEDQKFCMRIPIFHPQSFLKLSALYIPVHIRGSYKCIWWYDFRFPMSYSFWNKFVSQTH